MVSKRLSREAGHRRKFLTVVDETPECDRAVAYAARRAEHTGGAVVLLFVIEPTEFKHWLGVENIMRAEAMDEAEAAVTRFAERVRRTTSIDPELVIREGARSEEILNLIEEDQDIAVLVLASSTGSEGPGPLVSAIASKSGSGYPIPVTIVPGNLTDEDVEALG